MAIPARGRAPILLVSLALAGLPAMAQTYTVVDLGTLGGSGSQAHGINGVGQIVGDALTSSGNSHAFLYEGGRMSDLKTNGTLGAARAINDSGQVAGYYYSRSYQAFLETSSKVHDLGNLGGNYSVAYAVSAQGHVCGSSYTKTNQEHAFLWTRGRMSDLGTFGGEYSTARGINKNDQVVGYAYLASGTFHAFLRSGAVMTDLGTLGGDYSTADAINDAGQVAGAAATAGNLKTHACLWSGGAPKDLGELGGNNSEALAINSTGTQVVGTAVVPSNTGFIVYHAFLWSNESMRDLNALIPSGSGWVLSEANGINDSGQIVGYGTHDGNVRAFLLNPR